MLPPLLWTHSLVAGYGEVGVLNGVSIRVGAGQIVSVIGPNGAGKSTLLKAIYGLLPLRSGGVWTSIDGADREISHLRPHEVTAQGLNYVPQNADVFPSMSVRENLEVGAYRLWSEIDRNTERVLEIFPSLKSHLKQKAGSLSGGERRMLAVARALMSEPRVLLLDEPSAGVAPIVARQLFDQLRRLASEGTSLLMVEQNATRALEMSAYAYVLEFGRVRFEGPGKELRNDKRVVDLYLGRGRSPRRANEPPESEIQTPAPSGEDDSQKPQ
ncbi:MAG: ABC transporter ATP-binding protein [bacterium]